jgi:glycosyltransferase involved in cell wall biosynthesis
MRIMVQALGIHTEGGAANHLRGFVETLSNTDSEHDWTFVLEDALELDIKRRPNMTATRVRIRNLTGRLYEDFVHQQRVCGRSGFDVILNFADFGPLPRNIPTVSFQCNANYYDHELSRLPSGTDQISWQLRRRLAHRMVRRSHRVLCPSDTMAKAIRENVDVPVDRVATLHHPYEAPASANQRSTGSTKRILYTGHLMPHKNHRWLVEVFAKSGLAGNGVELWMTGAQEDWPKGFGALVELTERHGIGDQVRLLGRVPAEEMTDLYAQATVFVFASMGESFGYPMVEALSAGLPILAYDTRIAREILGPAAEFLPHDSGEAAVRLRDALLLNENDLQERSERSLSRARAVSLAWDAWLGRLEAELELVAGVGVRAR